MTPFARHVLARVQGIHVPRYGTPEWDDLPDQDPRRAAAVVIAAECWRDHCSPEQVAIDLLDEMQRVEDEIGRRIREASWDVSSVVIPARVPFAELQRRREAA